MVRGSVRQIQIVVHQLLNDWLYSWANYDLMHTRQYFTFSPRFQLSFVNALGSPLSCALQQKLKNWDFWDRCRWKHLSRLASVHPYGICLILFFFLPSTNELILQYWDHLFLWKSNIWLTDSIFLYGKIWRILRIGFEEVCTQSSSFFFHNKN